MMTMTIVFNSYIFPEPGEINTALMDHPPATLPFRYRLRKGMVWSVLLSKLSSNSFSFNIVPPVLFDIDRGQSGEIVLMVYLKGLPLLSCFHHPPKYQSGIFYFSTHAES